MKPHNLIIVVLVVLAVIAAAVIIFNGGEMGRERKQITTEQFQNVRAGDFALSKTYTGFWCPVKQKGNGWVTIRIHEDIVTLHQKDIDSIIFAPRDMDSNKWQKMALEYLATH